MSEEETTENQGSPRYIDEAIEAEPQLRPNEAESEERGTDQPPQIEGQE